MNVRRGLAPEHPAGLRGGSTVVYEGKPFHGMLWFGALDRLRGLRGVLCLGWRFLDEPDGWTRRFSGFKFKEASDIRGACLLVPVALEAAFLAQGNVHVVGAIPSGCEQLDDSEPVACLGRALADSLGWRWIGDALSKAKHRPLHDLQSAEERDAEISDRYRAVAIPKLGELVIVDDLVTRGSTMSDIARAVHERDSKVSIWGLALGKNERRGYAREWGLDLDNSHIPDDWARRWDGA